MSNSVSFEDLKAEVAEMRAALLAVTAELNSDTGVSRQDYGAALQHYAVRNTTTAGGKVGYGVSVTDTAGVRYVLFPGHKSTAVSGISAAMQKMIGRGLIAVELL